MPYTIEKHITGGFEDPTVSEESINLIKQTTKSGESVFQLGELFARYRSSRDYRDTAPPKNLVLEHLAIVNKRIDGLIEKIELVPEDIKVHVTEVLMKLSGEYYEIVERDLIERLHRYQSLINYSEPKIEGRRDWIAKGNYLERKLLASVYLLIAPYVKGKERTARMAKDIIVGTFPNISLPDSDSKLIAIIPKEVKNQPKETPK